MDCVKRSTVKRMDGDETRWRPPSLLCIPLVLCGGLIFFIDIFQYHSFRLPNAQLSIYHPYVPKEDLTGYFIKTEGCRIPYMDPYDPTVKEYIYKEKPVVCNQGLPPLMESNLTSVYLLEASLSAYAIGNMTALTCCYKSLLHRNNDKIEHSKECVVFNGTAEITAEFVEVTCVYNEIDVYRDFFSFVPKKSKLQLAKKDVPQLNVLVIGLDAVSRLNLYRQLPRTARVLQHLKGLDFIGYTKVGDNTFPNLTPVLTGLSEDELKTVCWFSQRDRFDNCPFLWKNYSAEGFATAFAEDSSWMGVFNYMKKGFASPPTDYYWGPFNYIMEKKIGNSHLLNVYQCVGGRMVYKSLLEYIDKFTASMKLQKIPYFSLFWGASLSHDFLNMPHLGDDDYAQLFIKLSTSKVLDDTVLVFMSDHGIRWGGIRSTYQGRMEERMPFLYIVLPESFKNTHRYAYANMKNNKRRLTTPFDLHETLKDLVHPFSLTKEVLSSRISEKSRRGYSLFEAIPPTRNCDSAGIASHWCTCQETVDMDVKSDNVTEVAEFAVAYINRLLVGYAQCATLQLAEVNNARVHSASKHVLGEKNYTQDYTIAFRTVPGNASFEATVRQKLSNKHSFSNYYNVTGTISRTNLYGSQSRCITDFHLKLYCYCT